MRRKIIIAGIFIIVAVIFFCLNLFVPYYDDDVWYALQYIPNEFIAPITRFSDIIISQYHHYVGENSRAIIHITLQVLLATLPPWGFDIVNTGMFLLFMYLLTRYTQQDKHLQPLSLLLAIAGTYCLLPDMDYLFYWAAGSLNYLWSSIATLILLHLWQHTTMNNQRVQLSTWLWAVVAWGCTFSHEAFAIPVGAGVLAYMVVNYRRIGYNSTTLIALACGLGCVAILMAPGMENKTQNIGYDSPQHYVQQLIITLRSLRVLPLCVAIMIISCCRRSWRDRLRVFTGDNIYLIITAVVALLVVLSVRAGAGTMRIFYASEFFALLLLLRYCNMAMAHVTLPCKRAVTCTIATLLVVWSVVVIPVAHRTGEQHHKLIEQYADDTDGVLFLPSENTPRLLQHWIINLHKYYYETPEAEWRAFVIPLADLNDTLKVPTPLLHRDDSLRYSLYNRYILILPHGVQAAVENPNRFFTPCHKVAGDNPFYITPDSCYIIASLDSLTNHRQWQWHYLPASLHEPSASLPGLVRRMLAPGSFPLTGAVEYPDTITLPDMRRYVIYARPPYRTLHSIQPRY